MIVIKDENFEDTDFNNFNDESVYENVFDSIYAEGMEDEDY